MNRQKLVGSVFLIIIVIGLLSYITLDIVSEFFFQQPTTMINKLERFSNISMAPLLTWINNMFINKIFYFIDEINIFRIKKDLLDGTLPTYDLKLSANDMKFFKTISQTAKKRGYLGSDGLNQWRNAELKFNGETYKIKTKLHGDTPKHWAHPMKSYKIKTSKEEYIENKRRFTLMLFEDRILYGKVADILAKELGLPRLRDDIVVLKLNGIVQGLYYLQEPVDKYFLENNGFSNSEIIKITDNTIDDHNGEANQNGIFNPEGHCSAFDYELGNLNLEQSDLNLPHINSATNELFNAIVSRDTEKIKSFIDIEQFATFEAARVLLANSHMVAGDNLRLIYDGTKNKFYPVLISENLEKLRLKYGGFESELNKERSCEMSFFHLLNQDKEIRHIRNQKLYSLIQKQQKILTEVNQLAEKYRPYATSYKSNSLNSRFMSYAFNRYNKDLKHNLKIIKNNLEYSKAYIGVNYKDNLIDIEFIPDSIAELRFDQLKINFTETIKPSSAQVIIKKNKKIIKQTSFRISKETNQIDITPQLTDVFFAAGMDEKYYPKKDIYNIKIRFNSNIQPKIANLDLIIINDITGQKIIEDDKYMNIANSNSHYNLEAINFDTISQQFSELNFTFINNVLTLKQGDYTITENLIIPKWDNFIIEKGTNIKIAQDKSVISYSPVNIQGTAPEPIVITAVDPNKPFATFGVVGDGNQTSIINHLKLSHGNEKWINGIFFSGGLSIHHINVKISNSEIFNNHADDGLNIKYGNVIIDNTKFHDNFADQVDLDFCNGVVKNSYFNDANGDGNGDGLDFSGSQILVQDSFFSGFQDKGISIGEKTDIVLHNNLIQNNNNGVAVKDSSHAYFINNNFEKNNISINAYQKKPLFSGGVTYLFSNEFIENNIKYQSDELSQKFEFNLQNQDHLKIQELIDQEQVKDLINFIQEKVQT